MTVPKKPRRLQGQRGPAPAFPGERRQHAITLTDAVAKRALVEAQKAGYGRRLGPYIESVLRRRYGL